MARMAANRKHGLAEAEQAEQADAGALRRLVGYNLKRAYMRFQADFRETMGVDGLSPRSFSALSLVAETPGITQSELSRILGIERSGLVAIIDELQDRKLLKRVPVPGDRRAQALTPTRSGNAAYQVMLERVVAHEERLLEGFDARQRETLLGMLRKLHAAEETGN